MNNKILLYDTTWMNIKVTVLREGSQIQKNAYSIVLLIYIFRKMWWFQKLLHLSTICSKLYS
jgi:hypothetical protein